MPLFALVPQAGGIPVPAPGPNPPPLVPAYARYAAYTTVAPPRPTSGTAASSPAPQQPKDDDDDSPTAAAEIDELADEDRPASKNGPAPDPQPDRPKKRSRPTRAHPSSPRVCTTCSRTDSPEWRRGPYGPKTLCNACGLKWAKASGAGRRRGGGQPSTPSDPAWNRSEPGPAFSSAAPPAPYPGYPAEDRHPDPISRPGTADAFKDAHPTTRPAGDHISRPDTAPELGRHDPARPGLAPLSAPTLSVTMSGPSSALGSSLPSSLGLGASASIGSVPPPPHSVSGSDSADERVKVEEKPESDAASGLMDLANVALEGREPQPSLKRPRADSTYDRPNASRYEARYDRSFSDTRYDGPRAPNGESGVRPINVIPIGGDKW